jgi:FkbM family methyltransferase
MNPNNYLADPLKYLEQIARPDNLRKNLELEYLEFSLKNINKILVVGASPECARLISICKELNIEIIDVFDSNNLRVNEKFCNFLIKRLSDIEMYDHSIPILIASHKPMDSIDYLRSLNRKHVAPFALMQILYPNDFSPHMFYRGWLDDLTFNLHHYSNLRNNLLTDDKSKLVLDSILRFRISLNFDYIRQLIDLDAYLSKDIVWFEKNGTYIDGGAFDGDTIKKYDTVSSNSAKKIIAFEPDPKTFLRLSANFKDDPRVLLINKGLYSQSKTLLFSNEASRASLFSESGGIEIPVTTIDEILINDPVSFIKLNIEGSEIEALKGGRKSIEAYTPILAISAYHSPDHLWKIAELIDSFSLNYQFFLRQQDTGFVETVLYATPSLKN